MLPESSEFLHEKSEYKKGQKKSKPLTRRRYKLPHPEWQKQLLSYYKMVNKKTTLRSSKRTSSASNKNTKTVLVDLVDELPDTCESDEIYILLATVSVQVNELVPTIILVHEDSFHRVSASESKIIKYDINQTSYAGRILASSNSRKKLENTFDIVLKQKSGLFKKENSRKDSIFYSCTSQIEVSVADDNEILVLALRHLLENAKSSDNGDDLPVQDDSMLKDNDPDFDENTILNSTPNPTEQEISARPFSSLSLSNAESSFASLSTISAIEQPNSSEKEVENLAIQQESSFSGSRKEIEGSNSIEEDENSCSRDKILTDDIESVVPTSKTRKRRSIKKYFADSKLLAKVKSHAVEKKKCFDESIESSITFVKQTLPTLKPSKPYQPIIMHLFKIIMDMNEKMEQNENIKSSNSGYKIERKIQVKKIKDKELVKIDKRLTLELAKYGYAIDRDQPHLIVSRFMRRCFDKQLKIGAEVNDRADESNFIYRIGSPEFDGHERLEDGQKLIDMIIDHSHQVLGLDYVCFKEYRECMTQVTKAIYDANRADGSKTRKSVLDNEIGSSQPCKRKKLMLETDDEEDEQEVMKTAESRVEMFI
ncbi:uncharacterized protein LOC128388926 [Panonychus citri]|uniref:uncharacterized protein LOC128388926 n=1 Tax=Panonychus citri TaxID=50023 RepID=UPI002307A9D8|nr:uncharacterized protein LOC128388926 [Panonychus citri]